MSQRAGRPRFGKASGSMNVVGVIASLAMVGLIVLIFFAWMLRDVG